jgi:hypothetical protein
VAQRRTMVEMIEVDIAFILVVSVQRELIDAIGRVLEEMSSCEMVFPGQFSEFIYISPWRAKTPKIRSVTINGIKLSTGYIFAFTIWHPPKDGAVPPPTPPAHLPNR